MNPVRGIETPRQSRNQAGDVTAFKLMNPVRGIETDGMLWATLARLNFQINESRSRD